VYKSYNYSSNFKGKSINEFLSSLGYPKSIITFLKKHNNQVLVNNKPTSTNYILSENDVLTITIIEHGNPKTIPTKMDLNIVYEDDDLIIINKDANTPVHTSSYNQTTTLQNGIKYLYPDMVFHCSNRLDTDTTGLILLAKNQLVSALLATTIIDKEYQALVLGKTTSGTINKPILKIDGQLERVIDDKGKEAITHYETINNYDGFSLIKLKLETGRTHQIRVHMASISHPLLGDRLYNKDRNSFPRCALHVTHMSFIHPIKKELMVFDCPLPNDMKQFLNY